MERIPPNVTRDLMSLGILSYTEQERLWDVARRCAKTVGVPAGAGGMLYGVSAGTVAVPLVGAVPGAVAGALAGWFGGTVSCVMLNVAFRDELRRLARGE